MEPIEMGRRRLEWFGHLERRSGRTGRLTGKVGKVSSRPATPHRETAAKGEKGAVGMIKLQWLMAKLNVYILQMYFK